jgi:hypothetical protein
VTRIARIRNLKRFRLLRRNEFERMAANIDVSDRLFDLRHMAVDTFIACRTSPVMRVRFDRRSARPIRRLRSVTRETHDTRWFEQISIISGSVYIVATEAGDSARVHDTRHEVVTLHAILVRCSIGKMCE